MSTIVAISTAPGLGGIGIIRMSGEKSFDILSKLFKPANNSQINGYSIKYGKIYDGDNLIDEVLVSYFVDPKSYTRENMCEINSHGGMVVMQKILELCIRNGAELAEPGEFTKRAFLNGRIDLAQAEAVIDIINSKTEKEAKASADQLQGALSDKIREIREELLSGIADIEAAIDYPEYDEVEVTNSKILNILNKNREKLDALERSFSTGKLLRDGIQTAIIGRPNSGKSSLLNILLNEERAIVTDIEGTTRDSIEEFLNIEGVPYKIIDTAGIRETEDTVEKIGVDRAVSIAKDSDIIIALFDITKELNEEDTRILEILKEKKSIIILNKIDLKEAKKEKAIFEEYTQNIIYMSMKTREGLDELIQKIREISQVQDINNDGEVLVTNIRHKELIHSSIIAIEKAIETVENGLPIDVISIHFKEVLENLGKITGDNVSDDIIAEIFSKFCLGK